MQNAEQNALFSIKVLIRSLGLKKGMSYQRSYLVFFPI